MKPTNAKWPRAVIETTLATRRTNFAIFSLDVLTDYRLDRVTDLNALAIHAQDHDMPEIEEAIREQILRENAPCKAEKFHI